MTHRWAPAVTVAAIVERAGELLMVEEKIEGRLVLNQPAGHLDEGESLVDAVAREVLEETGWVVEVNDLVGVHRWHDESHARTWLRFVFSASPKIHEVKRPLDPPVVSVRWMTPAQIEAERGRLRSPLVRAALEAHLAGTRAPLSLMEEVRDLGPAQPSPEDPLA